MFKPRNTFKKILTLFVVSAMLFEGEVYAFAQRSEFYFSSDSLEDFSEELSAIDESYLKSESGNEFEDALLSQTKDILKKIASSQEAENLAELKKYGQSKYGLFWPMYVKASGAKDVERLENDLKISLFAYYDQLPLLPYEQFESQYNAFVEQKASESMSSPDCAAACGIDKQTVIKRIKEYYPIKTAYKDYKDYASKEVAWRKANKKKVDKQAYEVVNAYVRAIGAPVLGTETLSILLGMDFNSVPALGEEEKAEIYEYNVARLEKQKLDALDIRNSSGEEDKNIAQLLLASLIETMMNGALISEENDSRYASALSGMIQRSEKGGAFPYILSAGFASLLANKNYDALDRLLKRYTEEDLKGSAWYDYFTFRHYTESLQNLGGRYLGKASELAQYTSDYAFHNVFTDIAGLLVEDDSAQADKLLEKYAFKRDMENSIKPFLAGALLYGVREEYSDKAAELANVDFGDIAAVQEADLDRALLSKYSSIEDKLNKNAVISQEREEAKRARLGNYNFLNNVADSVDILLAIWGSVSLLKMGIKGVSLAKSSYTALRAATITDKTVKIAYIKANYSKMVPYISAKRSFLRAGMRIKTFLNKSIVPSDFIKLQNDLHARQLAVLDEGRKAAQSAAQISQTPKAAARAALAESQYANKKAAVELGKKMRGEAGQSLISKYNAYRNSMPGLLSKNPFSPGELDVIKSAVDYAGSVRKLNSSFADYYSYLNIFEKGRLAFANKIYLWGNKLKNAIRYYMNRPYGYGSFVEVNTAWRGGGKNLSLIPAFNGGGAIPLSRASIREAQFASGIKDNAQLFMPKKTRTPFNPEDATFKIIPMSSHGGLGSGYYIKRGNLDLPLVFTASHVVGDARVVQVRDTYGNYVKGDVINLNTLAGFDLAAILIKDQDFLKGRVPFKLGSKEPWRGSMLRGHSYPEGNYYKTSFIEMLDRRYFHPYYKMYSYMTTLGTIMPGSSGGAVSLGDFDGTLVGMIMSYLEGDNKVLLVPLPLIMQFFSETVKKLLFDPILRNEYLSQLPGLRSYYSNILERYFPATIGSGAANGGALGSGGIYFHNNIRNLSLLPSPEENILRSSAFQIESRRGYGTGAYINYRGFDALLTAEHVIAGSNGLVKIISPTGETSLADVFSQDLENGHDLALLIPRDVDFFSGYKPLEISYKPPTIGLPLFNAGYQNLVFTFQDHHKLLYEKFCFDEIGDMGYYGISGLTGPGNSGAPFISKEGKLFGITSMNMPARDLSIAVRYSVIRTFIKETLIQKATDPQFDWEAFIARYPALGKNYSNVIENYLYKNGEEPLKDYVKSESPSLQGGGLSEKDDLMRLSGVKPMSGGWKNFRFWLGTKVFGISPKEVISSLYNKGALPQKYIPLEYTGESYNLPSLKPHFVEIKPSDSYTEFPFTNVRAYAHRGMSLSEKELLNIMDNGLRKVDMPDQNLAILAPHVTPGTKLQAISFSPYASVSARYATSGLSSDKGLPVMVDVMGIGPKTAHINVHGMFTSLDIPPERIKRYSVLLNIGGKERWGELTRLKGGGFNFRPYKAASPSAPAKVDAGL